MASSAVPLTIRVLGSGTSVGVPTIGCHCAVCSSEDPHDRRLRPSILVSYSGHNVLIDTTPDFRQQALRARLDHLDAVIFTHAHADHLMGLDDVRPFNYRQSAPIPVYGSPDTIAAVRRVFDYIFSDRKSESHVPRLELRTLDGGPFDLFGLEFIPIPVWHGSATIYGYRFGAAAYLTDHSGIPEESIAKLRGLDVLFLDALRHRPHPTHTTVERALEHVAELAPRRAFFTHICHDLAHAETESQLPAHVRLAYDGLEIAVGSPGKIFRTLEDAAGRFGPCVLTIGNFDGVHAGHRRILRRVVEVARERGWKPSVMTFDPHPARIVAPQRVPPLVTTPDQRAALMFAEGIEQVLILPFTRELSLVEPEEFAGNILARALDTRAVLVGDNFRFGHRHAGDTRMLAQFGAKFGFITETISAIRLRGRVVSSSEVRRLVAAGKVSLACRLLEAPFALQGEVVSGHGVGSKQTVPTLNLAPQTDVLPAVGVYITRTRDLATARAWPSVSNVGHRPTFGGGELTIETFLLNPLDGPSPQSIRVEFLHRLRDERKFPSAEALKSQILRDVGRARRYFRRLAR